LAAPLDARPIVQLVDHAHVPPRPPLTIASGHRPRNIALETSQGPPMFCLTSLRMSLACPPGRLWPQRRSAPRPGAPALESAYGADGSLVSPFGSDIHAARPRRPLPALRQGADVLPLPEGRAGLPDLRSRPRPLPRRRRTGLLHRADRRSPGDRAVPDPLRAADLEGAAGDPDPRRADRGRRDHADRAADP